MALSVDAATRTSATGLRFQPSSQSRVVSAQPSRIRHGLVCGYSSSSLFASETASSLVARPVRRHPLRHSGNPAVHAESLTSSRRVFTSFHRSALSKGCLLRQTAGNAENRERMLARAGSRRGVGSADGQTLDIPLIGEIPLPDFSNVRRELSEITPLKAAKWTTIVAVAYAAMSTVAGLTVFNADFWMYASWLGVIWPWPAAVTVGILTVLGAIRQAKSGTKEGEQVLILGGALVWLILVPLAHVHGFIDGWPILLYTLYYFFFSISAVVRERMYGTLSTAPEAKRWQSSPSQAIQIAFVLAIVGGHWAAAFESPFLAESWNWAWQSKVAAALIGLAVVVQWNAVYFLGKYSDRLVNPHSVVMFGPYRWVRHPMYASYMLLCAGYCLAIRSYFSLLFLTLSCIAYYDQRTKLEENNLVEAFGTAYTSYREKTKHKYLPGLY